MKKQLYKITVNKWSEYNPGRRGSFKKTLIANNLCNDNKLGTLPLSHRWLFLGIILTCGDHNNATVVMNERQVRALLESSKSVVSALNSLQSLQLVSYTIEPIDTLIEVKEVKRSEVKRSEVKRREEASPQRSLDLPPPPDSTHLILKTWNEHAGTLPKAKGLNSTRKKHVAVLWRENPKEEYWIDVVKKIANSNFCTGKNDRGWVATFDWFIRGDTHLKVLEGKYDNRTTAASTAQTRKYDKLDELEKQWSNQKADA